MNYETLKASIQAVIKANGNEEITGPILQQILLAIVNALGTGYQFLGIANSNTELGTPDQRVFYVAYAVGTSITVGSFDIEDEICILKYADSWTKETLVSIDTSVLDGSDNLVTSWAVASAIEGALTQIENAYAKKDGIYPDLVAGSAQGLLNPVALVGSFLFRPTGDGAAIGKGKAIFSQLRGKSLVWNQLVASSNLRSRSDLGVIIKNNSDGSLSISNTAAATTNLDVTTTNIGMAGHIYLLLGGNSQNSMVANDNSSAFTDAGSGVIFTAANSFKLQIAIVSGTTYNNIVWPQIFDLTKLFNGSVPANYTVADFQKDFPLPYYAYNAGKVIPFAAQDYEVVGFNQWDEEWINAYINASGQLVNNNSNIASKNYIRVFPDTEYCIKGPSLQVVAYYDANSNFIRNAAVSGTMATFTTPSNCHYIRFHVVVSTYNNDICINLSSPRNGEYEPYKKTTLHFNPAGWVDPSDNDIYPYGGMHGVGSAYDFAKVDADGYIRKATQAIGRRAYQAGDESDTSVVTDGSTFTYYALATPIESTLDDPIKAYTDVDGSGTEAWKPDNTTDPYTAPCDVSIFYPLDIAGGMISAQSFANFCSELSTKLGATLNKTISIAATYNAATEQYGYTITIS